MASRSGTANGANRDVECAYESGRRAIRYGAGLVCGAVRSGTACDTVWIGTACVLTDRDDERYGADLDGVRTATRSRRGAEVRAISASRCVEAPSLH